MTFDPTSLPQRLYLAEAIRCYIEDRNIPWLSIKSWTENQSIAC